MRVWFLRRIGVKIGRNVQIGPLNWFDFVWPEYIEVGDGTSLAGMTTIIAHSTPLHHLRGYFESYVGPVRIGKNVWIAVNCTILPNLSIGDCSVVAAGAVVTRDVEANVFVAEVPAKVIRRFDLNEPSERIHTESKLEHERCSRELNKEGVNHD
jgi:acetyltransferase-like isoleucine patch superfamily enzyme